MSLLFLLAMAQAAAAQHFPTISAPVDISARDMAIPISAALRSATLDEIDPASLPTEPVRYRFTCSVIRRSGILQNCMPANAVTPDMTTLDFARASNAYQQQLRDAPQAALVALSRVRWSRLAPATDTGQVDFVTISETVSAADRLQLPPSGPPLNMGDVQFEPVSGAMFSSLYPPAALRAEKAARVTATCRIDDNRHPLCRDGKVADPSGDAFVPASMARDFAFVTYQLAALLTVTPQAVDGSDVRGRDIALAISWTPGAF